MPCTIDFNFGNILGLLLKEKRCAHIKHDLKELRGLMDAHLAEKSRTGEQPERAPVFFDDHVLLCLLTRLAIDNSPISCPQPSAAVVCLSSCSGWHLMPPPLVLGLW